MGSLGNPKTWVPYLNNKDCSQGFCSLYCPQWCYIIYPPPPPLPFPAGAGAGAGGSSPTISPLVVAIIGILVSAFLLVSYYTIISKYCGRDERRRSSSAAGEGGSDYADDEPPPHEAWHVATAGLDEAAIKAIAVRKYRRGEGLVDGADCSVCLSEFEEGESVRLLPKCSHAFHIHCIDTWLRSHSNCPLCRAGVVAVAVAAVCDGGAPESGGFSDETSSSPPMESSASFSEDSGVSGSRDHQEAENVSNDVAVKSVDSSSLRAFSDLEERHAVIEVREEIRRSVSMDFLRRDDRVLVADILRKNCGCEEEEESEDHRVDVEVCCIERASCSEFVNNGKVDDCGHRRKGVSHCVKSPVAMKRSVSSGRFFLRRNTVIPL